MQPFVLAFVLACADAVLLAPAPAHAQATVDQRALEPLQQTQPAAPETTKPTPAHRAPAHPASRTAPRSTATPRQTTPVAKPSPPPPPPAPEVRVPLAPPPPPVLPPALVVPTRPPAPPPPVPVSADARGAAEQIPDGLRVTFGGGSAVLNPATEGALRTLAHTAPPDATFTVSAFAAGSADDPSTPRRLSLSRALAARSVLIAEGVASPRIYVKALGASGGVAQGPADRVDVTVAATNPQAKSPQ